MYILQRAVMFFKVVLFIDSLWCVMTFKGWLALNG